VELPKEIVEVLGQVLAARAPALLRPGIAAVLSQRRVVWADTGADLGRTTEETFDLHAVLGERLPDLDPHAMLAHLGQALEPLVRRAAQRWIADRAPA
jgi:hypothetical protein